MTGTIGSYVALCALPAAAFAVLAWVTGRLSHPVPRARPETRSRGRSPVRSLVSDLGRLERDYGRVVTSDPPMKAQRLQAISLAHDDVLLECSRALGLDTPAYRPPLRPHERLEIEAALSRAGLSW